MAQFFWGFVIKLYIVTKKNKEPELVSPGCSQAINKKTPMIDTSDAMLNKINPLPSTPLDSSSDKNFSDFEEKFEESFQEEDNAEYIGEVLCEQK
ncbi:hypothetical protein V1477_012919 [Vespula maculifrons]|uniref:Uncharacterized protein n=1 Tax=Vespula maculifrons TaxID=7453 RepID=A0ABD2BUN5_VESMC